MKANRKYPKPKCTRVPRPEVIKIQDIYSLQRFYASQHAGYQESLRRILACCYALCVLATDDPMMLMFLRGKRLFKGMRQPPAEDDVTKWVIFFVISAKRGLKRDRACRYAAILDRYLTEGVSADQVEQRLKDEGGVAKAYALSTSGSRAREAQLAPMMGIARRSALLAEDALKDSAHDLNEVNDDQEVPSIFGKGRSRFKKDRAKTVRKTTTDDLAVVVTVSQRKRACRKPGLITIYARATPNSEKGPDWMDIVAIRIKRRST